MFRHLLIPLDGSEHAEQALPAALELASRFNSEITLLRVVIAVDVVLSRQRGYAAAFREFTALAQELREAAERYLQNVGASIQKEGMAAGIQVVESEHVAETILKVSEKVGADTIVIGSHGHGGVRQWVLGSVADRVLHRSALPVVLIRSGTNESNPGEL